jgi:CHASE3 domain sensor protein
MSPTRKFVASGLFGIALGFAVLALASYVAVRAEFQRRTAGAWLRHTIQVQSDLYQLYGLLQAAESGQRGFISSLKTNAISTPAPKRCANCPSSSIAFPRA